MTRGVGGSGGSGGVAAAGAMHCIYMHVFLPRLLIKRRRASYPSVFFFLDLRCRALRPPGLTINLVCCIKRLLSLSLSLSHSHVYISIYLCIH